MSLLVSPFIDIEQLALFFMGLSEWSPPPTSVLPFKTVFKDTHILQPSFMQKKKKKKKKKKTPIKGVYF